jgi:tRNA 2-thiouridine synthesizing protein A
MSGRRIRLFGRGAAARRGEARAGGGAGAGGGTGVGGGAGAGSAAPFREAERAAPTPVLTIDALGRKCPIPIIMLAEQIGSVPLGAVVAVLADDPAAYTDIPSWCDLKAQEFVCHQDLPRGWALFIRRRL